MNERPRDLLDRLQVIADLRAGQMFPGWMLDDPNWGSNNWANGMSQLLYEAIKEIKDLRMLQDGYSRLYKEVYG